MKPSWSLSTLNSTIRSTSNTLPRYSHLYSLLQCPHTCFVDVCVLYAHILPTSLLLHIQFYPPITFTPSCVTSFPRHLHPLSHFPTYCSLLTHTPHHHSLTMPRSSCVCCHSHSTDCSCIVSPSLTSLTLPCPPSLSLALPHLPSPSLTLPHPPSPSLTLPHPPSPFLTLSHPPLPPSLTLPHPLSPSLTLPHPPSPSLTLPHSPSPSLTLPHPLSPSLTLPHPLPSHRLKAYSHQMKMTPLHSLKVATLMRQRMTSRRCGVCVVILCVSAMAQAPLLPLQLLAALNQTLRKVVTDCEYDHVSCITFSLSLLT